MSNFKLGIRERKMPDYQELLSDCPVHRSVMPFKRCVSVEAANGSYHSSIGKVPSGTWQAGSLSLGFRRMQQMMGQKVIESSLSQDQCFGLLGR